MRFYLILLVFMFMSCYAWRNWFNAACFLLLSTVILERPDMPQSLGGITGLSPWNLLFFNVFLAMIADKSRNSVRFTPKIKLLITWFVIIIIIGVVRELSKIGIINDNMSSFINDTPVTSKSIIVDHFINTFKYFTVVFFFFYGAKDQKSVHYGLIALAGTSFVLALQVVKVMPLGALVDGYTLEQTAIRKIDRDIGYFRSDLAVLFAGGAWVIYLVRSIFNSKWIRWLGIPAAFIVVLAMGLTGGRIGIGAWLLLSMVITWFRMKKMIVLGPLAIAAIITLVPAVQERFLQGLSNDDPHAAVDLTSATSGRADVWPYITDRISDAPIAGYGRHAMVSTGLTLQLYEILSTTFRHPHNAYLELFLDNGFLLGLPVLFFFILLLVYSFRLFKDKRNDVYMLTGGVAFALLFTHLVGSLGSQSFYPTASSVSMWCACGMMLRIYLERQKLDKKDIEAHKNFYSSRA